MNLDKITEIRRSAEILITNGNKDSEEKLNELFMQLFEVLGYSGAMINTPGAYDTNGDLTFNMCFKTNQYDDNSAKIYLNCLNFNDDLSNVETIVQNTCLGGGKDKKYFIIFNCLAFAVYYNENTSMNLYNPTFLGIHAFNDLDNPETLKILNKLAVEADDNLLDGFDDEDIDDEKVNIKENRKEKKEFKLNLSKELLVKIIFIGFAILILIIILAFLFGGEKTPVNEPNQLITNNNNNLNPNNSSSNLSPDSTSTFGYITLKGVLDLYVDSNDTLKITLKSDLIKDTVVKIGIFCGDNTKYLYEKIDESGTFTTSFDIPDTWGDSKVLVGAYLKFNETDYKQPKDAITKYGSNGENISWDEKLSKDMITYSETTHSNALVEALEKEALENKNRELKNMIEKDFKDIDTRVDAFGNIKHVPKNFSFDETNISEKINIYPMIFYDKASDTSYFYIISGYVGTQFLRFEEVSFSCDGFNWKYPNSTNEVKRKIVGNKKAEWVYFNSVDTLELLEDMSLLSSSNESKMILSGSINKTFTLTEEEKLYIKQFLYIYKTYYGNGTSVPETSWFNLTGEKASLNYIIKPDSMYQRGSSEINSLNSYNTSIAEKKLKGTEVTEEEQKLLDKMLITYRKVDKDYFDIIYNSVINTSNAELIYYDDYESNNKYMKIYFNYNKNKSIEEGYVPYINIFEDYTVLVPIKTITAQTTKYDKVFAKYYISKETYDKLNDYFKTKSYEQID